MIGYWFFQGLYIYIFFGLKNTHASLINLQVVGWSETLFFNKKNYVTKTIHKNGVFKCHIVGWRKINRFMKVII